MAGAREVIHHQGVEKTTIADIAGAADVPVGNVYYYLACVPLDHRYLPGGDLL